MFIRFLLLAMISALGAAAVSSCGSVSGSQVPGRSGGMTKVQDSGGKPQERKADAYAHFGSAVIAEMNGDFAVALDEYYKAARADCGYESLVLEVSGRLLLNKEPEKALDLLSRAAAQPGASAAIFTRLGVIYNQLGKTEPAITANRMAIKKAPTSLAAYGNLFALFTQLKRTNDALAVLDAAARQPKVEPEFLCGLAELYFTYERQVPKEKEKTRVRTLAVLNRAATLKPTAPSHLLILADGYGVLGDSVHAAQFYLESLKHLPDAGSSRAVKDLRDRIHAKLTAIYLHASDRKHASEQLEAILASEPTNASIHYCLATLALEDKNYAQAAAQFRETILLNPDFEQAYYDLATAQMDLTKPAEALQTLDQAREKFGKDRPSFIMEFMTGLAFTMEKAWNEALGHFSTAEVVAKTTEPKRLNEFFYFEVGAAYERKGDLATAEKYFQKCLDLAPAFAQALNYLGYMWAEHDKNLEKAREMITKALKAEPENGAYLDSMGWVLYKLNQPKEALDYLLKACRGLEKPDATVFDHLGDIYRALNQPQKAREAWQKSLTAEPNDEVKKKLDGGGPIGTGPK